MPVGPRGEKRPSGVIANAVHVMQVATREIEEVYVSQEQNADANQGDDVEFGITKDTLVVYPQYVALVVNPEGVSVRLLDGDNMPDQYIAEMKRGYNVEFALEAPDENAASEVSVDRVREFVTEKRANIDKVRDSQRAHRMVVLDNGETEKEYMLPPDGRYWANKLHEAAGRHEFSTGREVYHVDDWLDELPSHKMDGETEYDTVLSVEEDAESSNVILVGDIQLRLDHLRENGPDRDESRNRMSR